MLTPGSVVAFERSQEWISPALWRGRDWIWFMHFDEGQLRRNPESHGLVPILDWHEIAPPSARSLVESLVADLGR